MILKEMKSKNSIILISILFVILLFSCTSRKIADSGNDDSEKSSVVKVKGFKVKKEPLVPEIKTFGSISFKTKVDIHPKTSGRIEKLNVRQGDWVRKGQVLATLEQFQLQMQLKQAKAELEASKSSLELTKAKYEDALTGMERQFLTIEKAKASLKDKRASLTNLEDTIAKKRRLFDEGAFTLEQMNSLEQQYNSTKTQVLISENDLRIQEIGFRDKDIKEQGYRVPDNTDDKIHLLKQINTRTMRREIEVSRSAVLIKQTAVDQTNSYIEETYIKAPMSGIIAARYLELGEEAKPDQKLFTIIDTKDVYAKINVAESDLVRVKPNGKVIIIVDALQGKELEGFIELISPVVDAKTRTVELSVLLKNPDNLLKPGMFVRARIKSNEKREAMFIPATALLSVEKDRGDVFIVKKGIVFRKQITLGPEADDMVEVFEGLKDNEIIVDNPPIDLIDGDNVEILK